MRIQNHQKMKRLKGFTIIESLVFLFIFALVSAVFFQVYSVGTRLIIESKNRLGATALANQKMEIVRSLEYDAIGTTSGIPSGDLLEDETISVNTIRYQVHTFIQYVDDEFDGTAATSSDSIPTDYKRVRITVSWGNEGTDQTVALFGNFSPNGIETSSGGGVLSINVLDATGSGVSGATVHIVYTAGGVDVTTDTDATGNITLPGAPAGTESYELTVSKSGYYGAMTYPAYPTSSFSPVDIHASVVADVLNQKSIIMDQAIDIPLRTEDPFGTALGDIEFTLTGGRLLGVDPSTGENVYGFSQTATTDASGDYTFSDQSYGQYTFVENETGYEFLKMSPETTTTSNISDIVPGSTDQMKAIVMDEAIGSVRVVVESQADSTPIAGASVKLSNTTLGYDVTLTTDQYGMVYFPEALPALVNETYDLEVSASGYTTDTSTVVVNGALEQRTISLDTP